MTDRPTRRLYPMVLLALLSAPGVASAQLDDPGLGEPPPTAKPPKQPDKIQPVPTPRPPDTVPAVKPPPVSPLPSTAVPVSEPAIREDVKEEVSTQPTAALTDDEWEARMTAPTLMGPVGLLRAQTAEVGRPLNLRVGTRVQLFKSSNFLIGKNSSGGGGDQNSRFLGDLTIAITGPDVVVMRNLELYLGILNSSNLNERDDTGRTDPKVILSLGDIVLGLKGAGEVTRGISVGGNFGVRFFNSISDVLANPDATNFDVNAIGSVDVRRFAEKVPLRFHLNLGYLVDRSLNLLPPGQCANSMGVDECIKSRVVETFAYGLGVQRLRLVVAADVPLRPHVPWGIFGVDIFAEYHYERAFGNGDQTMAHALASAECMNGMVSSNCIVPDRVTNQNIQYMTAGLRLRPLAGLSIDAAVDIGFQSPGFQFGPPLPAWNVILGANYTYDPATGGTRLVKRTITKTVEVNRAPPEGRLRGVVRDAKTKKPVAGAIVKYSGRQLSPQATAEDGSFVSYGMMGGPVTLEVSRGDDYEPTTLNTSVEVGTETPVEVVLKPKPPREAKVHLKVSDDKGAPLPGAMARFVGPITRDASPEGDGFMASLPAGDYTISVDAPNFLSREKQITVAPAQDQTVDLSLHKRPAV